LRTHTHNLDSSSHNAQSASLALYSRHSAFLINKKCAGKGVGRARSFWSANTDADGGQEKKKDQKRKTRKERRDVQFEKDKERSVIVADNPEEEHEQHQRQLKAGIHMEITTNCSFPRQVFTYNESLLPFPYFASIIHDYCAL
jgi:hypothetical protein